MKPINLCVVVECASVMKDYSAIVQKENIDDVVANGEYLEAHRTEILQQFLALALYDCSQAIFNDINRRLSDGGPKTSHN